MSTDTTDHDPEAIAIVGIGCRLPGGARSPGALWRLLCDGVDAIGDIPVDRWDPDRYYSPRARTPGRMICRRGGCLADIIGFDADFFGIAPRVAEMMDPQQRILLEVTWEALENAGLVPGALRGSPTGVYMGVCSHDYGDIHAAASELEGLDAHAATGTFISIVANRLSYTLDLRGPSMAIDTACSSSLVAVHLACRGIQHGECDLALAGGVNVMLSPHFPISLSQAMMLSPEGQSRAFDASANGYVRGEGAGVVVLKRLSRALADRDRIYAVIRATAVNQDGRTPGITMPDGAAQRANVAAALRQARLDPVDIGYVEAHGTGTEVGDPIEANALGEIFSAGGRRGPERPLLIGSIKTNIGHLEAGAGIAGLIKAALVVHHRAVPPSLHFRTPNPKIELSRWRLVVPTATQPWPSAYSTAIAGINSFGFGGTNAHCVLAQSPAAPLPGHTPAAPPDAGTHSARRRLAVFPLSARSASALTSLARAHADALAEPEGAAADPAKVARFLAKRRSHHDHRLAVVAADIGDAAQKLREYLDAGHAAGVLVGHRPAGAPHKLAFLFNGQGPQWWAMGRALLLGEPVFRETVEDCDLRARAYLDWSIIAELLADESSSRVHRTEFLQPAMFAVQMGLFMLWQSLGVIPEGVMGHSLGDITAACAAGLIDRDTALRIICHRARIQDKADPEGGMLYAALSPEDAEDFFDRYPHNLWLSAVNSPQAVTFSGTRAVLRELAEELTSMGIFARILRVNCACHSPQMDPLRDELMQYLADIRPPGQDVAPSLPFYSTVTGQRLSPETLTPEYFWQNFRQPVRFYEAATAMLDDGFTTFVELSPHPVLLQAMHDIFEKRGEKHGDNRGQAGSGVLALHSLRRDEDDHKNLAGTLAALYVAGHDIDWSRAYPEPADHVELPGTVWQHEPYFSQSAVGRAIRCQPQLHPMIHRVDSAQPTWETRWDDHRLTWVSEHKVFGGVVVPAAAYIEMALAATAELKGRACVLDHLEFERPCVLQEGTPMLSRITLLEGSGRFEIHSRPVREDTWTRHVRGRFWLADAADSDHAAGTAHADRVDLQAIRSRCSAAHRPVAIYETMARKGYVYGPSFCGIKEYYVGATEALARIEPPRVVRNKLGGYHIHPVLLDACFQSAILHPPLQRGKRDLLHYSYLPTSAGRVRVYRPAAVPVWCLTRVHQMDSDGFSVTIELLDEQGERIAEFSPLVGTRIHDQEADSERDALTSHIYAYRWQAEPVPTDASQPAAGQNAAQPSTRKRMPAAFAARLSDSGDFAALGKRLEAHAHALSGPLGRRTYHAQYAPAVRRLCRAYLMACLAELGVSWRPGTVLRAEALAGEGAPLAASYRAWLSRSLRFLAEDEILLPQADAYVIAETAPLRAEDPSAIWRELTERFPDCHPEIALIRKTGPALARVLTGKIDPLELLFPEGSQDAAEALYDTAPIARIYNQVMRALVEELCRQTSPERRLRILEVGAGTGGLTAHLVPALVAAMPGIADRVRYHVTDISPAFLRTAEAKLADVPFVEYSLFDVEREPTSQGLQAGSYDLVVAADVLHATSDLGAALAGIHTLLAPGGMLAVIEALPQNPWLHLTFGLTQGWWRFQDVGLRGHEPLLSPETWRSLLGELDFADPMAITDAQGITPSGQAVLLARVPVGDAKIGVSMTGTRPLPGNWLVFADEGGLGDAIAAEVRNRGQRCVIVRREHGRLPEQPASSPAGDELVAASEGSLQEALSTDTWEGILYLRHLDSAGAADRAGADHAAQALLAAAERGTLELSQIITALAQTGRPGGKAPRSGAPRLIVVTRGSQPVRIGHSDRAGADQADRVDLAQAPLWGLGLVSALELPELHVRMVDLEAQPAPSDARQIWNELWRTDAEREVALRGGERLVRRLIRLPAAERLGRTSSTAALAKGQAFALHAETTGTIDSVEPVVIGRRPPMAGEVEVEVRATAINFLDVMTVLGQVPRRDVTEHGLGGELAGVVTRVGAGVAFQPGDEVIVVRGDMGALASHVTTQAVYVVPKPKGLRFEEACQIPIAFLTAWYALAHLARVEPGERVLIHAATGGTGLACLQVARLLGAEIVASAGSAAKRDYLHGLGVGAVVSSRSLSLADEVMAATGARGVDVVINSLAGEAAAQSLLCLAPYGRFVELGKRDFLRDSDLGLRPFLHNLSYMSFDLRQRLADKPEATMAELARLLAKFEAGALQPLPYRVYHPGQVKQALRHMSQGSHIGKLTVAMSETPVLARPKAQALSPERTWLVAGGLGGVGLRVAETLASRGVKNLVLLARTVRDEARERAARIEQETGARVRIEAVDICDRDALRSLLDRLRGQSLGQNQSQTLAEMPPLGGVVHCAMVLADAVLTQLDARSVREVLAPKLLGAWHLHELTAGMPLDGFLLFSSMASMLGNPGQASYAVANSFLDALAWVRKAAGLPVTCINWGVFADAGYVAERRPLAEALAASGAKGIGSAEALELLLELMSSEHPQLGVFRMDWERYARQALYGDGKEHPRYQELMSSGGPMRHAAAPAEDAMLSRFQRHAVAEQQGFLREQVQRRVALVLGLPPDKLDIDRPLTEYLDSLLVVEIVSWLKKEFAARYTLMDIMKGVSVRQLAADLQERLQTTAAIAAGT